MARVKVAHKSPGRLRLRLMDDLDKEQANTLIQDLKVSPEVAKVTVRGRYVIIEHNEDGDVSTTVGRAMSRIFPDFERLSDQFDGQMAKAGADPWVNKFIPAGVLGLAIYTGLRSGALLAGESAFALGYVAFDLYWKFQQENVIRKMEQGLSARNKAEIEDSPAK